METKYGKPMGESRTVKNYVVDITNNFVKVKSVEG